MMKKIKLLFAVVFLTLYCNTSAIAQNESFQIEGDPLYYELIDETHAKVVAPTTGSYTGVITIPSVITYPIQNADPGTASVVQIAESAFANSTVTSIKIPSSVITISSNAFKDAKNLSQATFASLQHLCSIQFANINANPLYNAHHLYLGNNSSETDKLDLTTLPNNVTSIGQYAFAGGSEIISVKIPARVNTIGKDAFNGCTQLQTAEFASVEQLLNMNYANEAASPLRYTITVTAGGNSLSTLEIDQETIKEYVLSNCSWLKKVTIGSNVRVISKGAFMNCRNLNQLEFENGVTTIQNDAFKTCSSLKNITLPSTLQSIGVQAFSNCWVLEKITIPSSVTNLSNEAFMYCYGLKKAVVNASASINHGMIPSRFFYGCSGLEEVELCNDIVAIGSEAFRGCSSLQAFPISSKVNFISTNAFTGCNGIQILDIPASMRQISTGAFSSCSGLTQLKINNPDSDNETLIIDADVFTNCDKLKSIYSYAVNAPNANDYAFRGMTGITLYLDDNVDKSTYNKAPWTSFTIADMKAFNIIYLVDDIEVYRESFKTGADVTPWEYDLKDSKPEGWVFSGWQDDIPTVMPNQNVEIHGYWTINKLIGDLFYHLDPIKKTAAVLQHDNYKNKENMAIPASVEFATEEYTNSTYSVVIIGNNAFENCTKLETITLANSIDSIGNSAFSGCSSLSTITLPAKVTALSDSLFYNCEGLVTVVMGNVTVIRSSAFNQCTSLSIDELPSTLTTIGTLAFSKCKAINTITIPASVTELGDKVFLDCDGLVSVSFSPDCQLTNLPENTFKNCSRLKSFTLPSTMSTIKNSAFMNCRGLEVLEIPNSIRNIYANAFNGCTNLKQVIIPENMATFGSDVFKYCTNITQVTTKATTPPEGSLSVFEQTVYGTATLNVPNGSESAYSSKTLWSAFTTRAVRKLHNLTLMVDGEIYGDPIPYWTGDAIKPIAEPQKQGHIFSKWKNLPEPFVMPDEDVTVSGSFDYNITFKDAEDETVLYTSKLFYGDQIEVPEELNRKDYIFTLNPTIESKPTMPAEDYVIMVTYIVSETEYTEENTGIRYYLYTQTKENIVPHAEVMSGESAPYTASTIEIPSSIDYMGENFPVTAIRNDAFKDCKKLTSLTLPGTIKAIGTQAFSNCVLLTEITIPGSVETIGSELFLHCSGLTTVIIEKNSKINTLPTHTFKDCSALETVSLPTALEAISNYAFIGCSKLKNITITRNVTSIGEYAFLGCKKLEVITIENPTTLPEAYESTFEESTYEKAKLYASEGIQGQLTSPWDKFLVDFGNETTAEHCAKPMIFYNKGIITFTCAKPAGAKIKSDISVSDAVKTDGASSQTLNKEYVIKAYAYDPSGQYLRSDIATATIIWKDGQQCELKDFDGVAVHEDVQQEQQGKPGDMNGDGQITAEDAALILKYVVGKDNNNNQSE